MGNKLFKAQIKQVRKPIQPDVNFKAKLSKNDEYFKKIEKDANLLSLFNIEELFYLLNEHQKDSQEGINSNRIIENSDSFTKESSMIQGFKEDLFNLFLEKKICKNSLINQNKVDEKDKSYFLSFYKHYIHFLVKSFKNLYKILYEEKLQSDVNYVPKLAIIPLFFYFGKGTIKSKTDLLFNILSNSDYQISLGDNKIRILLFFLILGSSGIFLLALNEYAKEDEEVRKVFQENEFVRLYDMYQVKDATRIMDKMLKSLFSVDDLSSNKSISYDEFIKKFHENQYYWIFSASGVRGYLESNQE